MSRLLDVDDVPNLRMLGVRILQCIGALVLGFASAVAIAMVLPHGEGREASLFAPLFLIFAMGAGLALGWFALFEALRRMGLASQTYPRAMPLPVARALRPHK